MQYVKSRIFARCEYSLPACMQSLFSTCVQTILPCDAQAIPLKYRKIIEKKYKLQMVKITGQGWIISKGYQTPSKPFKSQLQATKSLSFKSPLKRPCSPFKSPISQSPISKKQRIDHRKRIMQLESSHQKVKLYEKYNKENQHDNLNMLVAKWRNATREMLLDLKKILNLDMKQVCNGFGIPMERIGEYDESSDEFK